MIKLTVLSQIDRTPVEAAAYFRTDAITAVIEPCAERIYAADLPYDFGCEVLINGIGAERSFHVKESASEILSLMGVGDFDY